MATQIDLGMAYKDWTRVVWTFVEAAGAVALTAAFGWATGGDAFEPKTWIIAGVAAGLAAVKNFFLSDTSTIK